MNDNIYQFGLLTIVHQIEMISILFLFYAFDLCWPEIVNCYRLNIIKTNCKILNQTNARIRCTKSFKLTIQTSFFLSVPLVSDFRSLHRIPTTENLPT